MVALLSKIGERPGCRPRFYFVISEAKDLCISPQTSVHLRINSDRDVFERFKRQREGHLTRMNSVLRSYVETMYAGGVHGSTSSFKANWIDKWNQKSRQYMTKRW